MRPRPPLPGLQRVLRAARGAGRAPPGEREVRGPGAGAAGGSRPAPGTGRPQGPPPARLGALRANTGRGRCRGSPCRGPSPAELGAAHSPWRSAGPGLEMGRAGAIGNRRKAQAFPGVLQSAGHHTEGAGSPAVCSLEYRLLLSMGTSILPCVWRMFHVTRCHSWWEVLRTWRYNE